MARSRPKKRRIIIVKGEDKGDLQISGGEAKLRLTPKLFLTFLLLLIAAVAVVVVAVRYSGRQGASSTPSSPSVGGKEDQAQQTPGANHPPQVTNAAIIPDKPVASSPLDVKYEAADQDGNPVTCTFTWFVNDSQVQEGTSSALQPGPYRSGDVVFAEVTPADASSKGPAFRTAAVTIGASAPVAGGVMLQPDTAVPGDILTAHPSGPETGRESLAYKYQWYVNGTAAGNSGPDNTFDTKDLKKHDSVSVAMTASDGALSSDAVRSGVVYIQNRNPEIVSSAPDSLSGGSYSYQVVARDADGDALKYRLERAPAGMTIDEGTGLIQWNLKGATMYAGRNEAAVRVTVDDGDGGRASQDFTIVFTDLYVP